MEDNIELLSPEVREFMQKVNTGNNPRPAKDLELVFGTSDGAKLRKGELVPFHSREDHNGQIQEGFIGAALDPTGEHVLAIAAAVRRNPGKSQSFLEQVEDFSATSDIADRNSFLDLVRRVYRSEGMVNNAVQKSAALIATEGTFKVRNARGARGKSSEQKQLELVTLLKWWAENVNSRSEQSMVTGDRGVPAFIAQGSRRALVDGDHLGRTNWSSVEVPTLGKKYNLPMNLQTLPPEHIQVPEDLLAFNLEVVYWAPPRSIISRLTNPRDPAIKEYIDKFMDSKIMSELKKNGKVLLDSALLFHVKNRGTGIDFWGESMIQPAMTEVAYKRALQALDIVTIENLINRLVIIMVGSDDPTSIYHSAEISNERLGLMQRMLTSIGPSATIIWPGPDVSVEEVGAHNTILNTDDRYKQVEERIRNALGVAAALLTGEASSGKAAGWAATLGQAAALREIQNQYKIMLTVMAERIANENGFKDVDVVWEFHKDLLTDQAENAAITLKNYIAGLVSARTALEEMGLNYDAELVRMLEEVKEGWRGHPFEAPQTNATAPPGQPRQDDGGRPPAPERPGERDPRDRTEDQTTD